MTQSHNSSSGVSDTRASSRFQGEITNKEALVIRQPIFDCAKHVHAYELLCQPSLEDAGAGKARTIRRTIHNALCVIGLETLLGGKAMFIDVTAETLVEEDYVVLPSDRTVLVLNGSTVPSVEMQAACRKARNAGFTFALDNYEPALCSDHLLDMTEILKVDVHNMQRKAFQAEVESMTSGGRVLMATGVKTHADSALASALGMTLIQGFFFCQPDTISGVTLSANQMIHVRLLAELNMPHMDFERVESTIKSDVALTCNLLRFINGAALGVRQRITSVRQALVLLGERTLRKWGSIVAMAELGRDRPHELLVTGLIRAHFSEGLAAFQRLDQYLLDSFMIGLLSTIDAVTNMPMEQAIASLPLCDEVRAVLLGDQSGPLGGTRALVHACERGAWQDVNSLCSHMPISQRDIAGLYYSALNRICEIFP